MTINSGTTLTVSKDASVYAITGATFTYGREPSSVTVTTGTMSGVTSWTGSTDTVTFTFTRYNAPRISQFVITYTGYTWN